MTALDICKKRDRVMAEISYLGREVSCNNTETVLLTNDEVVGIINALNECVEDLEHRLSHLQEE